MVNSTSDKIVLQITNFTKIYPGGLRAVDKLNLCVNAGDIFGFIGHNGAGKTTTIRALVGVMSFDEGEIIVDGRSLSQEPIACKSVMAYIPDNPDIYEYLTGIQYLNFIGDMFNVSRSEREERIKLYGDLLGMTGSLGDLIGSYSHGMKQKTVVIGAFLHKPKLMVLDEPFVGLDPEASFNLKNLMRDLCRAGSAIFFSTHVLDVAEKLCNKIAIIKSGKLVASGNIESVLGDSSLEQLFLEVARHDA